MSASLLAPTTPPPAGVFRFADLAWLSPSSNHGVKILQSPESRSNARGEGSGVWDFVTITCARVSLRSKDENGDVVAYAHGARSLNEGKVSPTDILDWLLPGHALRTGPFDPKGWQGYKQSAVILAPGIATPVGVIARDGNHDTVCVSISGAGMFAVNLRRARLALEHYGARITRLDAAFDDLDGVIADLSDVRYDAVCGMFDASSKPSSRSFVDDLGSGSGSSLYVGRKGDKQLNIYEKGKQQGDAFSPWVRYEVRLWSKNRHLPLSILDSPLGVMVGAYPRLAAYLPAVAPARAKTMRRQVEAKVEAMVDWLASAAGKSIGVLRESAKEAGATDSEILDLITRDGMPSRFVGLPAPVVTHRTAEYLQGAIP